MKKVITILFLAFLNLCLYSQNMPRLWAYEGQSPREAAMSLNDFGLEAYGRRDYLSAAAFFQDSILYDSTYLYAHYNLACTLNLIRDNNIADISLEQIWDHLYICRELDSLSLGQGEDWFEQMVQRDSDLQSLRNLSRFSALIDSSSTYPYQYTEEALVRGALDEGEAADLAFLLRQDRLPLDVHLSIMDSAAAQGRWGILRLLAGYPKNYSFLPSDSSWRGIQDSFKPDLDTMFSIQKDRTEWVLEQEDYLLQLIHHSIPLLQNSFFPQPPEMAGDTTTRIILGHNSSILLILEKQKSSVAFMQAYSLVLLDIQSGQVIESLSLYESELDQIRSWEYSDILFPRDDYIRMIKRHGLSLYPKPLGYHPFPLEDWHLIIEMTRDISEEIDDFRHEFWHDLYLESSQDEYIPIGSFSSVGIVPIGWCQLPGTNRYVIALFFETYGFEMESDYYMAFLPFEEDGNGRLYDLKSHGR